MKTKLSAVLCAGLAMLPGAVRLLAHHSIAPYDTLHGTRVRGVVTKFVFANPHTYIDLDAKNDRGEVEHWVVECDNTFVLRQLGWTKAVIKPGDDISILGARAKTGATAMRCHAIDWADGRTLACVQADDTAATPAR